MLVDSLWHSFRRTLRKKTLQPVGRRRLSPCRDLPFQAAEVLEVRCLLSSILVDTTPITTINGVEGQPQTDAVLMTFTDDNSQAQATDFSVTSLDWGGTTVGTVPTAQVVSDPNYTGVGSGWMVVVNTVSFGDIGTYSVSLTVHATDGAEVSTTNTSIVVADAALTNTTPAATIGQTLGTASTNVTLMTLTDANPYAAADDFSVTMLDWGGALSGPSPTVTIVSDSSFTGAGSGWKVVADSLTYADAGLHTVSITVEDQDGGDVSSNRSIRAAALTDTSPGATIGATQGAPSTNVTLVTFTSTDPQAQAANFSVSSLDWGGTLVGVTPTISIVADTSYTGAGSGWIVVADTVSYAAVGSHTVSVTIKDQDGISTSSAVTIFSVSNAALADATPVMTTNAWTGAANNNVIVMLFTDDNPYATASQYSVSNVNWGGALAGATPTTSIVANPHYTGTGTGWMVVVNSLIYPDVGQYIVSVTVQDESGETVSTSNVTFDVALLVLSSQMNRLPSTTAAESVTTEYVVNETTKLWEMTAASAALTVPNTSFVISWTGSANAVKYSVYYSDNGGAFTPFVTDTTATSATFTGAVIGHTYAFYSIAKDVEGTLEDSAATAQTSTTIDALSAYPREAGLEGFYFVDGAWAKVVRNGTAITLIDGSGQAHAGTISDGTQISASDLEGTYDPDEGTIIFDDGAVWEQARQIAGRWLTNGRAEVGIQQLGTDLTLTNAQGTNSSGYFSSADDIVATDWGLTGKLTSYGTRIRWSDGTVWDLVPEMDGANANAFGNPTRLEQFGSSLVFVNRFGQTSAGLFIGQNLVMATDWGNIIGKLKDGQIYWTNGTIWTHQQLTGTNPDLGGLWDVDGSDVRIMQTNSVLTFVNKNGQSSTGHFLSATVVVADDWGGAQGVISGDTLTWTSSGTVWTRLPDLGGAWLNSTSTGTGINQLGRTLTLTDAQGVVSHATLTSPTQLKESDGGLRTATISGSTITFDDGAVWSRLNALYGNWSIGASGAALVQQSVGNVLFVTSTGTVLKGSFTGLSQLSLTELGASNPPAVVVAVTNKTLLTFDDQSQWQRIPVDSLDATFADLNLWPFL